MTLPVQNLDSPTRKPSGPALLVPTPPEPRGLVDPLPHHFLSSPQMVSVCTTCKGLQKHLRGGIQETESGSLQWLTITLPSLRRSTNAGCRACALLLQGILLHHERFAGVKEENVKIAAESFSTSKSVSQKDAQGHLSVEVRWKQPNDDSCDQDEHQHEGSYPDLKLEYFTDEGMLNSIYEPCRRPLKGMTSLSTPSTSISI